MTSHFEGAGADHATYIAFGEALGYMNYGGEIIIQDVHGAGCQRSDPKSGDPTDSEWEYGHGPQGDIIHINNFVRLVRENPLSTYNFEDDDSEDNGDINGNGQLISSYPLYFTILITITAFAVLLRRKNKNLGNGSD